MAAAAGGTDPAGAPIRVGVAGYRGKVGVEMVRGVEAAPDMEFVGGVEVDDDLGAFLVSAHPDALIRLHPPVRRARQRSRRGQCRLPAGGRDDGYPGGRPSTGWRAPAGRPASAASQRPTSRLALS